MSFDFSEKNDLVGLARLVRALQEVAQPRGIDFFLMGAAARDLMLRHGHGIDAARLTEDTDLAVMAPDWATFEDLRAGLIAGGQFTARPGPATHRLRHRGGSPLDIVPFGGVERIIGILVPEADEMGGLLLARQSGTDLERARRLLEILCDELATARVTMS